tara:strand:+ start:289 stop:510 length:222 start_codon:yes stop_codon:yes gene_type:complete
MIITKTSTMTGLTNTMELDVTQQQIEQWEGGMLIQNAMPNLTPEERDFILFGATSSEWAVAYGDMEEVYDEDR